MFDSLVIALVVLAFLSGLGAILLLRVQVWGSTLFSAVTVAFLLVGATATWAELDHGARVAWGDQAVVTYALGAITFSVTAVITYIGLGASKKSIGSAQTGSSSDPDSIALLDRGLLFGSILLVGMSTLYYALVGYIPLLEGVGDLVATGTVENGLTSSYRNSRDTYASGGEYIPGQGLLEAIRYWGMPLVILWCVWGTSRRTPLSILLAMMALLNLVGTGQRWPLMFALVAVLIYGTMFQSWGGKELRLWLGAALAGGIALTILLGRGADNIRTLGHALVFGASQLVERIFVSQTVVPFQSYALPRDELLVPGGTWTQNLLAYLPGPGASYPVTFSNIVLGTDTGFTAPPDFMTEAYINGGLLLVIVLSAAWAIVLTLLSIHPPRRAALRAPWALLVTCLGFAAMTGVSQLLSVAIVFVIAGSAVWAGTAVFRGATATIEGAASTSKC